MFLAHPCHFSSRMESCFYLSNDAVPQLEGIQVFPVRQTRQRVVRAPRDLCFSYALHQFLFLGTHRWSKGTVSIEEESFLWVE